MMDRTEVNVMMMGWGIMGGGGLLGLLLVWTVAVGAGVWLLTQVFPGSSAADRVEHRPSRKGREDRPGASPTMPIRTQIHELPKTAGRGLPGSTR